MKLPILSAREVLKALNSVGFQITRQSGSHIILMKFVDGKKFTVVVPKHDEIAKGTLLSIIQQSGIAKEEFLKLL
ncbi:type II toxin-antitoxin system HicA family toxin [Candidatus Woesearchaeota archaeon]|nr:type II toxin-antitoxin system HicA family toxin [Candidatus Woesearchaeota archaeon]